MFMISNSGASSRPLSALVLYNIAFILPLAVIAATAIAFSSRWVGRYLENKIPLVKLATAALFFILGIALLLSIR